MIKISYSQSQLIKNRVKLIVIIIGLLVLAIICFWLAIKPAKDWVRIITGLFYCGLGFSIYPLYSKLWKKMEFIENEILDKIDISKKGNEGEIKVFSELDRILDKDGPYTVHRNFVIPNRNFDIDAVIVGPKGIIVLEIKNYKNQLVFIDNRLFISTDSKILSPISPDRDPRKELQRHLNVFIQYLAEGGFTEIRMYSALVFSEEYTVSIEKGTKVGTYIICGAKELEIYVNGLPIDLMFTPDLCLRINSFLQGK